MSRRDDSDELARRRAVELSGMIDDAGANELVAKLLFLQYHDPAESILLSVDSPGGLVTAALGIMDSIEFITCPVHTHVRGQAEGVAALIAAAGRKGFRSADRHARLSILPSMSAEGRDANDSDLRQTTRELASRLSKYTGRSAADATEDLEQGRVFDAEQAKAYGLIDRVEAGPAGSLQNGNPA